MIIGGERGGSGRPAQVTPEKVTVKTETTLRLSDESQTEIKDEFLSSDVLELRRQIKIAALRKQLSGIEVALKPLRRSTERLDAAELLQNALLEQDEKEIHLNIRQLELPTEIIAADRQYEIARTLADSPRAVAAKAARIMRRRAGSALGGGDPSWRTRHGRWTTPEDEAKADLARNLQESQSRLNNLQRELASIPESLAKIQKQRKEMDGLCNEAKATTNELMPPVQTANPSIEVLPNRFVKDGDVWHISFQGKEVALKDSLGLAYLHELIQYAGRSITADDLFKTAATTVPIEPRGGESDSDDVSEYSGDNFGFNDEKTFLDTKSITPARVADVTSQNNQETLRSYGQTLKKLLSEQQNAERNCDTPEYERLEELIIAVKKEIQPLQNRFGRARGDDRKRQSVRVAIMRAIRKIQIKCPELGEFLRNPIILKLGYACIYLDTKSFWELS